jgi:CHRD domain
MPDKKSKLVTFSAYIALFLGIAAIFYAPRILPNLDQAAYAQEIFAASNMTGANEVPPVNSTASGSTMLLNNETFVEYDIAVSGLYNATAAHIHQGRAGNNGPIVATLYNTTDPSPGLFGGFSGNITATSLEGPLKGHGLSDLVGIMSNGQAYVNIHTIKHKNGEIRDQVTEGAGNATGVT